MKVMAALANPYDTYNSDTGGAVRCEITPKPQDEGKGGGCQDASQEFDNKDDNDAEALELQKRLLNYKRGS